ncbi:MAG: hypothetical protein D6725_17610 [Planctomycetota bacterium]|nr:MAG: hypothetical protein D6725_17610 [Planctomycetota bacterium]
MSTTITVALASIRDTNMTEQPLTARTPQWPWVKRRLVRIGTHGCPHHVDELVAVCLLERYLRERGVPCEVVFLSREEIETAASGLDVLVDVGGRFDPAAGRFDHHQGGPDVEGRSAAGLVFDALYADSPDRNYLEPVIRHIDWIDTGRPGNHSRATLDHAETFAAGTAGRGPSMLSLSAVLKAVGGFQHDVGKSAKCLEIVRALVDSWFRQAATYREAEHVVRSAEKVGGGLFLPDAEAYGPGLLEYLSRETNFRFVGFPVSENRFYVVAVRDVEGQNRILFPQDWSPAAFVHDNQFLAVFPDADSARHALQSVQTKR